MADRSRGKKSAGAGSPTKEWKSIKLEMQNDLAEGMIETAQTIVLLLDTQGRIVRFNPYLEHISGYALAEVQSRDWFTLFLPERERESTRNLFLKAIGDIQTRGNVNSIVTKDGCKREIEWYDKTLKDVQGNIIGLLCIGQDITERKRAEEALKESEERFRCLVESAPEGIFVQSQGHVLYINPAMVRLLGASRPQELLGAGYLERVAPEYHEAIRERIRFQRETGKPAPPMDQEYLRLDGARVPVETMAVAVRYQGSDGHIVFVRDITEQRKLREQFVQAQKMEAVGQLAGGVAHDFRNQLMVIKGYGEMLLRQSLVKDKGRNKLKEILKAADRSVAISGQLLAFSRQQILRSEVINVNSVAGSMMESLVQTLGEDIQMSVMPQGGLWNIRVDTGQFQQALLNIVLNARDAMSQGGQLTIETDNIELDEDFVRQHAGASAGRHVVVTVSDNGTGMDAATLGRIFEPFFTTKPVGEGTGLGLAMVHGFVAQSGGFIDVRSRPGEGTTFRLYFPAVDGDAESALEPSEAPDLPRGSGTILVVEDEKAIRQLLVETLGEYGYTVMTAGNAQEAMAIIESASSSIDLLITDVVMPGWSGPELARHFQAALPGVRVLMMSGHTSEMLSRHGVVSPGANLLVKPFSPRMLAETVGKLLRPPARP